MEIEKISFEVLRSVRLQLGANDNFDTSMDEKIKKMTPMQIMKIWSKWHIGDETWAMQIISKYNTLINIVTEEENEQR